MGKHIETGTHALRFAVVERGSATDRILGPAISYHQNLESALIGLLRWHRTDRKSGSHRELFVAINVTDSRLPRNRYRMNLLLTHWNEYRGPWPWEGGNAS